MKTRHEKEFLNEDQENDIEEGIEYLDDEFEDEKLSSD